MDDIKKCIIRRNRKAAWRIFDDQGVVLDTVASRIFGVNRTGARIWDLLREEQSFDKLVNSFAREYGKSPDDVKDDVTEFLLKMRDKGLIELS